MNTVMRKRGFTLVELLTVIVIISLLLTILVPTIAGIMKSGYAAKTKSRINTLETGAMAYYESTNRMFLPGQQSLNDLSTWTGSQLLAKSLFMKKDGVWPTDYKADGSFIAFTRDMVINDSSTYDPSFNPATDPNNMALSDAFPDPMAICYYVSRPRSTGLAQYVEGDNTAYTGTFQKGPQQSTDSVSFKTFITNPNFTNPNVPGSEIPFKDRLFILIAPGMDRKYFTQDDVTNLK